MGIRKGATAKSEQVTDQVKLSKAIEASIDELRQETHQRLVEKLGKTLPERTDPPDFVACQDAMAAWLAHQRELVAQAENTLLRERRQDSRLRTKRDRLVKDLVAELRKAQFLIDSVLGPGWSAEVIGIGTGLHQIKPERLEQVAAQAVAELRNPDSALATLVPTGKSLGGAAETATLIEDLQLQLSKTLDELSKSLRRTQTALGAKQELAQQLAGETQRVTAVMQAIYRLAGLDFHADRLRPPQPSSAEDREEQEGAEIGSASPANDASAPTPASANEPGGDLAIA